MGHRHQIEQALCREIAVEVLIDSKSLINVILKGSCRSEKWLMIDVGTARVEYQNKNIENMDFIRIGLNIASDFIKSEKAVLTH